MTSPGMRLASVILSSLKSWGVTVRGVEFSGIPLRYDVGFEENRVGEARCARPGDWLCQRVVRERVQEAEQACLGDGS